MSTFSMITCSSVSVVSSSISAFFCSVVLTTSTSSSSPFPSASPESLASSSATFFSCSSILAVSMLLSVVDVSTSSLSLVHSSMSLAFSAGFLALWASPQLLTAVECLTEMVALHLASFCLCASISFFLCKYFFLIYSLLYLLALSLAARTHFFWASRASVATFLSVS